MSNQSENENQQPQTSEDVRQFLLAELDASKQAIGELSNEQLEAIAGGAILTGRPEGATALTTLPFRRTLSAPDRLQNIHFPGSPSSSSRASESPVPPSPGHNDASTSAVHPVPRKPQLWLPKYNRQ